LAAQIYVDDQTIYDYSDHSHGNFPEGITCEVLPR